MNEVPWGQCVAEIEPFIVKIETNGRWGTGFILHYSSGLNKCIIATAKHVVEAAQTLGQPLTVWHHQTGRPYALPADHTRSIWLDPESDVATIAFERNDFPIVTYSLLLAPPRMNLAVGSKVGWLGFPCNIDFVAPPLTMCFFAGHISATRDIRPGLRDYLVDGVSIHGVSGGPVFWNGEGRIQVIGVISAYWENKSYGKTLPGLAQVTNVEHFHAARDSSAHFDQLALESK